MNTIRFEPTLIIYALLVAINVSQIAAAPVAAWVHALILGVTGFLSALLNRSQVTPSG